MKLGLFKSSKNYFSMTSPDNLHM